MGANLPWLMLLTRQPVGEAGGWERSTSYTELCAPWTGWRDAIAVPQTPPDTVIDGAGDA